MRMGEWGRLKPLNAYLPHLHPKENEQGSNCTSNFSEIIVFFTASRRLAGVAAAWFRRRVALFAAHVLRPGCVFRRRQHSRVLLLRPRRAIFFDSGFDLLVIVVDWFTVWCSTQNSRRSIGIAPLLKTLWRRRNRHSAHVLGRTSK